MNILYFLGLSDRLAKYFTDPVSELDYVKNLFIIRNKPASNLSSKSKNIILKYNSKLGPLSKMWSKIRCALKIIKKHKPALIISFLLWPHGIFALIVSKITRTKVGVYLIAGPIEIYTMKSVLCKYSYTKELPKFNLRAKIYFYLLKKYDFVFVAGNFTKNFLIKNGFPSEKIHVIPYSITDNCFYQMHNVEKKYDLIHVGRIVKNKHIDVIIKLTKNLKENFGLKNIKVSILGTGPELQSLKNMTTSLDLNDNVIFLDYQEDITKYYNESKITIITSEREAGPYTLIESMHCGVPVVGTKCGDTINDVLISGYNGELIEDYNDIEGLSNAVYKILSNESISKLYSQNCLKLKNQLHINNVTFAWDKILSINKKV